MKIDHVAAFSEEVLSIHQFTLRLSIH